ncbi:MAG: hypothetical protein WA814_13660 [Candidatus Baltobacteraceae bacterium]
MPLFPPDTPVTVEVDGRPLAAYVRAFAAGGRVFAPVSPLLEQLADRLWFEGSTLVIERAGRRVRVALGKGFSGDLNALYVPAGPVLRALGASVRYEPAARRLEVRLPAAGGIASPTPFNPQAPLIAPNPVFTPLPIPTPRPIWTGSPLPRRTPLPQPPGTSTTLPAAPPSTRT